MKLLELTNEQKEYQLLARKFAREEIIPKAKHHDLTGEVENNLLKVLKYEFIYLFIYLSFHGI
jgi:hypothetical protein